MWIKSNLNICTTFRAIYLLCSAPPKNTDYPPACRACRVCVCVKALESAALWGGSCVCVTPENPPNINCMRWEEYARRLHLTHKRTRAQAPMKQIDCENSSISTHTLTRVVRVCVCRKISRFAGPPEGIAREMYMCRSLAHIARLCLFYMQHIICVLCCGAHNTREQHLPGGYMCIPTATDILLCRAHTHTHHNAHTNTAVVVSRTAAVCAQ